MQNLLLLRSATPEDLNYVYKTWLEDLRLADPSFLPNDIWFPAHREVIRRVLEGTDANGNYLPDRAEVTIMADREAPENIVGYLVRDSQYLHWIHIRQGSQWRNRGLAKYLLTETKSLSLPLVWRTKLSHEKLKSAVRSRQARHAWWSTAPLSAS